MFVAVAHLRCLLMALLIAVLTALQLPAHAEETEEKVSPGSVVPRVPVLTPGKGLAGQTLIDALRDGGFVLYMRHAETGEITKDCAISNLTPAAREQAARVGEAIRTLKLPIDRVLSSEFCRVIETAKLMNVAPVEINEDLTRAPKSPEHRLHEARTRLIATPPPLRTNRLLAGHMVGGNTPEQRVYLDFSEIIVFHPVGEGRTDVVARIRASEWSALIELDRKTTADKAAAAAKAKS